METYLIYIGKVALAAGAFYLAFLLLFQNQKHFTFNRIYLPVSLFLSFGIPLITFTSVHYIEPASTLGFNGFAYLPESTAIIEEPQFIFEWYHYLFGIYVLGSIGFLFYLLLGHFKAISIVRKSRAQKLFSALVNITIKDVHPFSFFSKIVISKNTLQHPSLQLIVEHENIHVKEKHTLDILFAEILFLFQWFNPFAWLLKDAMKNNLEYLTDHQIAKNHNPQEYQLAMVALADKKGVAPFLNALNGSQLKNRIIMMKKKTENKYAFVKQLVVLPLLAVLIMGLSNKEVKTEIIQPEIKDEINISNGDPLKMTDKDFIAQLNHDGIFTLQDYGENAPLLFLNGKEVIGKIVFDESDLKSCEVLKPEQAIEQFGERGKNGAMLFNTEKEFEWPNPIKKLIVNVDGKVIDSDNPKLKEYDTTKGFDSGTIIDALELNGKVEANALDFGKGNATLYIQTSDYKMGTNPDFDNVFEANKKAIETKETFYAVNNEIVSKAFFEKYGKDGFESVIILTGEDASEKYGNNYETVVDAKTGSSKFKLVQDTKITNEKGERRDTISKQAPRVISVQYPDKDGNFVEPRIQPLYIVDGIEVDNLEAIAPDNIESIDVLKDKSATKAYGKKGKNGVVIIKTKNAKSGEIKVTGYGTQIRPTTTFESTNNKGVGFDFGSFKDSPAGTPLYIVNGVEFDNLEDISPDNIERIDVLKDKSAIDLYGEKGKNGVVLITTKKATEKKNAEVLGKPTIIVDGKEFDGEINEIDVNDISSIEVKKNQPDYNMYDNKGPEKDKIIINTKTKYNSDKINDLTNNQKSESVLFVEEMPEFPGGETALKNFVAKSVKYPEIAKENGIQGTVYVKFTIDKTGKVVHPEIAKGVDPSLDKEALRVANTLPKWKPGKQRGKAVDVQYTVPVNFELPSIQNSNKTIVPKNILYIVDGVEFKGDMKDIDPDTIESVNVLKDESASKKYGIEGKDGVIEIKLKPSIIDTELKLRKFIAKEIKYPLEAVETNTDGIVSFLFRVDKNGHIFDIMKARKKDIDLETVVVSAYKTKAPGRFIKNQERDLLTKEVKRVIEKVPVIQIPEFSGKTVQVSVKFVLQD